MSGKSILLINSHTRAPAQSLAIDFILGVYKAVMEYVCMANVSMTTARTAAHHTLLKKPSCFQC